MISDAQLTRMQDATIARNEAERRAAQDPQVQQLKRRLDQAHRNAVLQARAKPGELLEVTELDYAGRRITRFHGDPGACWNVFKLPVRRVIGWGVK